MTSKKTGQLTEKTLRRGWVVLVVSTKWGESVHRLQSTLQENQEYNYTDDISYLENICRTNSNNPLSLKLAEKQAIENELTSMEVSMF